MLRNAVILVTGSALSGVASVMPASSYVQNGLIGHYDALENGGAGVHDATATTLWKDLSGAAVLGDMTLSDRVGTGMPRWRWLKTLENAAVWRDRALGEMFELRMFEWVERIGGGGQWWGGSLFCAFRGNAPTSETPLMHEARI